MPEEKTQENKFETLFTAMRLANDHAAESMMRAFMEDERNAVTVKVHAGTSSLTRDLLWCACHRGLSLHGTWHYCPRCGAKIDQESYQAALEEARRNGITFYYRDPEDAELILALTKERDDMKAELTKWISVYGNV